MLKFFRTIRRTLLSDNKTGKYLKYAIGEVILVMVGILLALQVNNWNEESKTNLAQNQLLTKLSEEITQDVSRFKNQDSIYQLWEAQADNILSNVLSSDKTSGIVAKNNPAAIAKSYMRSMMIVDKTKNPLRFVVSDRMNALPSSPSRNGKILFSR